MLTYISTRAMLVVMFIASGFKGSDIRVPYEGKHNLAMTTIEWKAP